MSEYDATMSDDGDISDGTLSYPEELLWEAESPGGSAVPFLECTTTLPFAIRLTGPLDRAAVIASLGAIVGRHDVLRSQFVDMQGVPTRTYIAGGGADAREVDLRSAHEPERAHLASRILAEHAATSFNLARGPLWRAVLIRTAPDDHVFALSVHHIVFDLWSKALFLQELRRCYGAVASGMNPLLLERPSATYRDYVQWQRRVVRGEQAGRLEQYWAKTLEGVPELTLPADRGPATVARGPSGVHSFTVLPGQCARLQHLSRQCHVTLATAVLALLFLFLARTGDCDDVAVGVPVSDRRRREFLDLIGLFANLLVIRARGLRGVSFVDLLQRTNTAVRDAYLHQDLPYGHLRQVLDLRRPPFKVLFNFLQPVDEPARLPGLELASVPLAAERSLHADWNVSVRTAYDGLKLSIVYRTDLYSAERVDQLARALQSLIGEVLDAPAAVAI